MPWRRRMLIREWIEQQFGGPEPKVIIEAGANVGQDTVWLARLPNATVHAIEADPRNAPVLRAMAAAHVRVHAPLAIADHDGTAQLIQSARYHERPWTESSSIHKPTGHLVSLPHISFFDLPVKVDCLTLDTFAGREGIGDVSLIWADLQGAEPDMIHGGRATLARTLYLYAEVPPAEEYEGQLPLEGILALLPGWTVVERWPSDVLLVNEASLEDSACGNRGNL